MIIKLKPHITIEQINRWATYGGNVEQYNNKVFFNTDIPRLIIIVHEANSFPAMGLQNI